MIIGGTTGALLRHAIATTWPQPRHLLASTTVTTALAFMIAAYLLASGPMSPLRSVVFGVCCSAASLSAYAVLTVSQTPRLSIAFLTLTPAAAIAGLLCGLVFARVTGR